ncbi:hypothetical protein FRC09_003349 [Ceratobasidium sp. 395]|nr:hypothetical protein FRC09_003349 [Ceratobasidium sp. 395]
MSPKMHGPTETVSERDRSTQTRGYLQCSLAIIPLVVIALLCWARLAWYHFGPSLNLDAVVDEARPSVHRPGDDVISKGDTTCTPEDQPSVAVEQKANQEAADEAPAPRPSRVQSRSQIVQAARPESVDDKAQARAGVTAANLRNHGRTEETAPIAQPRRRTARTLVDKASSIALNGAALPVVSAPGTPYNNSYHAGRSVLPTQSWPDRRRIQFRRPEHSVFSPGFVRAPRSIRKVLDIPRESFAYTQPNPDEPESSSAQIQLSDTEHTPGSPLHKTLVGCDLTEPSSAIVLSLLVVAYGQQNTEYAIDDPEYDAQYLGELFKQIERVRFKSLSDSKATLSQVEAAIKSLWDQAPSGTHLLLLLTGHGIDNSMELYGSDKLIDESYFNKTFQALYYDSPKEHPVTIIFDICRDNSEKAVVEVDQRIGLVWTCSLGQKSFAFKFKSPKMPRSLFLIGLFMASSDVSQGLPGTVEERLEIRVGQLNKFHRHVEHVIPGGDSTRVCAVCFSGQGLCNEALMLQTELVKAVDLTQSRGHLNALSHILGEQNPFVELSKIVSDIIFDNRPFLTSNCLSLPSTSQRGATRPSVQASVEGERAVLAIPCG